MLREEGYRVILANSNPATIMTDPDFADATYVEPLDVEILTAIIEQERPDALLPTLGGQTALNLAMELVEAGVLDRYGVELIGANAEAIATAEDREQFKEAMQRDRPRRAGVGHRPHHGRGRGRSSTEIGLPVVIRPAYILGGRGTGIAATPEEFEQVAAHGLDASPITRDPHREVDRRVEGVRARGHARPGRQLRDHLLDREPRPDGRAHRRLDHRGARPRRCPTSSTSACATPPSPASAGSAWRPAARTCSSRSTPTNGDMVVIEMNPRVSRSSRAGVEGHRVPDRQDRRPAGRRLHARRDPQRHHPQDAGQLRADHRLRRHQGARAGRSRSSPAPAGVLGTQMQSVGEAMAIGRTFPESLQKALRSLEQGRLGLNCDPGEAALDDARRRRAASRRAAIGTPDRPFQLEAALRRGITVDDVARGHQGRPVVPRPDRA